MGSIAILISCLFFAIMAVLIKPLSNELSGLFISGFRFLIGVILILFVLYGRKEQLRIVDRKTWLLRGFYGAIAMTAYFIAVQITSSGRANLLSSTYPIFVAIFGTLFFGEKLTKKNILCLIFCITGMVLVFYDRGLYPIWGDILSVVSSITAALAIIYLKKSREHNSSLLVYLSACLFGILALPFSFNQIANINAFSLGLLIFIGCIAFIGQILMTYGFKTVSATQGSILTYAGIPLTLMLSYIFLGEPMQAKFLAGIGFVLMGLVIDAV